MNKKFSKLVKGDKVAILSPSFAAPGRFPDVYKLGLERLETVFGLVPIEYPATAKLGASAMERSADLVAAFQDPDIKAVIATIGGDDQVTYIKNLPAEPFMNNPKPFFGYSDNSHFCNFLFLNGIPSYYGGSLFTQFAMQGEMDEYTVRYIKHALFEQGEFELIASQTYNDQGLDWDDESLLKTKRQHWPNEGFVWDGNQNTTGLLWGGCIESVDEMLRHGVQIPTLEQFENIVLMLETSEEIPSADYVFRVFRALDERGILERVQGVLGTEIRKNGSIGYMEIIELTPQDGAALESLKAKVWSAADKEHYGDNQPNFFRKEFTLIAKDANEVVGYITVIADSGVAQIEPLMVNPEMKGKGIGTRLLQASEEKAKSMGVHKVWLETGADWKARDFYEKHDYVVRTILPNHTGGRDFVLMDKMI